MQGHAFQACARRPPPHDDPAHGEQHTEPCQLTLAPWSIKRPTSLASPLNAASNSCSPLIIVCACRPRARAFGQRVLVAHAAVDSAQRTTHDSPKDRASSCHNTHSSTFQEVKL